MTAQSGSRDLPSRLPNASPGASPAPRPTRHSTDTDSSQPGRGFPRSQSVIPEREPRISSEGTVTGLLLAWRGGAAAASDQLFQLVYDELGRIAHGQLGRERTGHTFDTSALVHEAYLRLVDQTRIEWVDRSHFFAIATIAMRRILVDYARRYRTGRRGGAPVQVGLTDAMLVAEDCADLLLDVDEALRELALLDERLSRVVECRFFGGLTEDETAEVLGVTARTVRRDWIKAKGWLHGVLR